jgi:signal transduction histidine kinase
VGLGMALAHRILRWHQGDIFFHMESPKRANITILLTGAIEPVGH